jgi:hypothetical protein
MNEQLRSIAIDAQRKKLPLKGTKDKSRPIRMKEKGK